MIDETVVNFIRDRFNSLENAVSEGFEKVDERLKVLEDDKIKRNTSQTIYSIIGGGIVTFVGWLGVLWVSK